MLVRARIKNFQLVKDLDLRFDPVTTFVGQSDRGKSCIFRSLEALLNNARGNKFITHGESDCAVMWQSDRGPVEWIKSSKGSATYLVGGDPDHKHKFVAQKCDCGAQRFEKVEECPQQAKEMLGIAPIQFGEDIYLTVNLAGQFDNQFLIFETGSKVAKVLGKFTRLDEVYAAVRVANKDLGDIKGDLKVRRELLEEAEKKLEQHQGIENLEPLLGSLERSAKGIQERQDELGHLENGLKELVAIRQKIDNLKLDGVEEGLVGWPLPGVSEKIQQILKLEKGWHDVRGARIRVESAAVAVERQEKVLKEKETLLERFKAENKVCPACSRPWL